MFKSLFKNLGPIFGLLLSSQLMAQERLIPPAPAAPKFNYNEKVISSAYSNFLNKALAAEDIGPIDRYFKTAASVTGRYFEIMANDQRGNVYRSKAFIDALHAGNQGIVTADKRKSSPYLEAFYHQLSFGLCSNCTAKQSREEILLNAAEQVMNYVAANLVTVFMGEPSKAPIDLNDFFAKVAKGNTSDLFDEILKQREQSVTLMNAEAKKGTLKSLNRILFSGFGMISQEVQDQRGFSTIANTFERPAGFEDYNRRMVVAGVRQPVMSAKTSTLRPTYSTVGRVTYRWTFGEVFEDSNGNFYTSNGSIVSPEDILQDTEFLSRPGNAVWKFQIMPNMDPCRFPAPPRNPPVKIKTESFVTSRCKLTFQVLEFDNSMFPHFALIGAEPLPAQALPGQGLPGQVLPGAPRGIPVQPVLPGPDSLPFPKEMPKNDNGLPPSVPALPKAPTLPKTNPLPVPGSGPGFGPIPGGNQMEDLPPPPVPKSNPLPAPKPVVPKVGDLPPAAPMVPKAPMVPPPVPKTNELPPAAPTLPKALPVAPSPVPVPKGSTEGPTLPEPPKQPEFPKPAPYVPPAVPAPNPAMPVPKSPMITVPSIPTITAPPGYTSPAVPGPTYPSVPAPVPVPASPKADDKKGPELPPLPPIPKF